MSAGRLLVAESGIHSRSDIERLVDAGIWNFLIGESIVRSDRSGRIFEGFARGEIVKKDNQVVSWASPQIKVCGLTVVEEAVACVETGADAIGLVFYPPSPRFVDEQRALEISVTLPEKVWKIGVFVDAPFLEVMKKVEFCRLNCVQLHGTEPPKWSEPSRPWE